MQSGQALIKAVWQSGLAKQSLPRWRAAQCGGSGGGGRIQCGMLSGGGCGFSAAGWQQKQQQQQQSSSHAVSCAEAAALEL